MPERTVTVGSSSGLHARPAALFVKAAARQPVPVRIRVGDGKSADARSILAVLALRIKQGTEVTLSAEDPAASDPTAADAALDELAALLARDLDQEPVDA